MTSSIAVARRIFLKIYNRYCLQKTQLQADKYRFEEAQAHIRAMAYALGLRDGAFEGCNFEKRLPFPALTKLFRGHPGRVSHITHVYDHFIDRLRKHQQAMRDMDLYVPFERWDELMLRERKEGPYEISGIGLLLGYNSDKIQEIAQRDQAVPF